MSKLHIGILSGGKSTEHEISIKSALNIFKYINKKLFIVSLIFINKKGLWFLKKSSDLSIIKKNNYIENIISIQPNSKFPILVNNIPLRIDVIFPIIHGNYGEDGAVQGFLRMINLPFVGSDILGSSINMDKDITKRILHESNIPIVPFICLKKNSFNKFNYEKFINKIHFPVFIKPSNQGSSIGVSKVINKIEFYKAIEIAFDLDTKIIVEKEIIGKEIECGVLGNDYPRSSLCGEIIVNNSFYNYNLKYIDIVKSQIVIPAQILHKISKKIRNIALKSFKILECKGMARVDFFLTERNEIFVNEINTLPGFTDISMYPKLWIASNISYSSLLTKLIQLAVEYYNQRKTLKFNIF